MYRSIPVGNKICAKRNLQRDQEMHRTRIKGIKPQVDTREPSVLQFEHLRNNLKREQMLEERYSEIDRENRILLQKMSDIMRHPTLSQPRYPAGPVSLNRDFRKTQLIKITQENQAILRRIQRSQPMYNHVQWEESHRKNNEYLRNCAEYPITLRKRSMSQGASIMAPLEGSMYEDSQQRLEQSMAEDREQLQQRAQTAGPGGREDELRYVLKEGKRIGDGYYLVEMATDGRTLTVSAYDGDSQQTLELLVNEKNHRKLYRECNGDYSAIAARLRVEGDRLVLAPDASPLDSQHLNADDVVRRSPGGEDGY